VQAGVDLAASRLEAEALAGCEVWVATTADPYLPTKDASGNAAPADPQSLTFALKPGVELYGGFTGSEATREARDLANPTVLSGNLGQLASAMDNAYHVVVGVSDSRIDGFTITGGNAMGSGDDVNGGGMLNKGADIVNCTFLDNLADEDGACLYNLGGSPLITSTRFDHCSASNRGGAVAGVGTSATYSGCQFVDNEGSLGGAAFVEASSTVNFTNCQFRSNAVEHTGGGVHAEGKSTLTSCVLWGNQAGGSGAGIYTNTGAVTLIGCTVAGNRGTDSGGLGGGLYFRNTGLIGAGVTVVNSILALNTLAGSPGTDYQSSQVNIAVADLLASSVSITYSLWPEASSNYSGLITSLPQFADSQSGDLHLLAGSPGIDAGNGASSTSKDLEGKLRVDAPSVTNSGYGYPAYVDMGAYEYQP